VEGRPPVKEKKLWQRYIYLWINYALFEELEADDGERCREVYKQCLRIIPHAKFSFSKIWIMHANFELRQQNLDAARAVFGNAMGRAPKPSIFEAYISTEQLLGNMDRCRVIYEKHLQFDPSNVEAWVKFTELEHSLGELERSRAIFELAVNQPMLDMPEMLWKAYIDFEISEQEYDKVGPHRTRPGGQRQEGARKSARGIDTANGDSQWSDQWRPAGRGTGLTDASQVRMLYDRLLARTKHVKVYISWAQFESAAGEVERARKVFQDANTHFKSAGAEHKVLHPPRAALQMPRPRVRGGQPSCGGRDRRSG
jgi:tetratricopeptide (TPR) repeat protein